MLRLNSSTQISKQFELINVTQFNKSSSQLN
jgi:hypothetical protein